jgi:hypothetical protein
MVYKIVDFMDKRFEYSLKDQSLTWEKADVTIAPALDNLLVD